MERMAESRAPHGGERIMLKRFLANEFNILTARVFLGSLLLIASIDKIADPLAFARSIEDYQILSGPVVMVIATVLPWIELICGMAMVFGLLIPGAALLSGALLFVFTLAVLSALFRGLDISCGCFSQDPAAARIGWAKVGENVILTAVSAYLYFSPGIRFSLEHYLTNREKNP